MSGILADEMGLGKTVMAIAFLAYLLEHNTTGPHLIVVPLSVLHNWYREFEKWLPSARVTLYCGSKDERRELRNSIGFATIDHNWLARHHWQSVI
eukprot:gene18350-62975_t